MPSIKARALLSRFSRSSDSFADPTLARGAAGSARRSSECSLTCVLLSFMIILLVLAMVLTYDAEHKPVHRASYDGDIGNAGTADMGSGPARKWARRGQRAGSVPTVPPKKLRQMVEGEQARERLSTFAKRRGRKGVDDDAVPPPQEGIDAHHVPTGATNSRLFHAVSRRD